LKSKEIKSSPLKVKKVAGETYNKTKELLKKKMSVEEIATERKIKGRTVISHIEKIVKEDSGELVKYVSDSDLSEDIFEEIFNGVRINYRNFMKEPFKLTLQIFQLNTLVTKIIPNAEKILDVDYRGGQKIKVVDSKKIILFI